MLDFLRLAIPIIPTHVRSFDNHHQFNGDIRDYGVPAATRHVSKTDDGQTITGELYPYEALPSDYTDMAVKFYTNTMNTVPYVEIKASPLKLCKGTMFMVLNLSSLVLFTCLVCYLKHFLNSRQFLT
jgi:II/X family phage/plasmid replication protein